MTNAIKAGIIAALNAAFGVAVAFGAPLTADQIGAVMGFANVALALVVLLTYKNSPRRIP